MFKNNSSSDDGSLNIVFFSALIISLFFLFGFLEGETAKEGEIEKKGAVISSPYSPEEEKSHSIYADNALLAASTPTYRKPQKAIATKQPEIEVIEKRWVEVTGYSSTVDQTNSQPFITASGAYVRENIVAANFLDFGTEIRIPDFFGDTIFTVKDRMNRRYSPPYDNVWHDGYIDVWFHTRQEALRLGRRTAYIEILK